jgi:hypothetical protein
MKGVSGGEEEREGCRKGEGCSMLSTEVKSSLERYLSY